eukprot:s1034_g9.t1
MAPLVQIEHSGVALLDPQATAKRNVDSEDVIVLDTQRESPTSDLETTSRETPSSMQGIDPPEGETERSVSRADIADLRDQLSSLRQVMSEPAQVLIHRSKSHIVHAGSVCESSNNPIHWKTRCGWNYGLTSFFRVQSLQSGFRGCQKCFRDQEGPVRYQRLVQTITPRGQAGRMSAPSGAQAMALADLAEAAGAGPVEEAERPIAQAVLEHMWQEALRLSAVPLPPASGPTAPPAGGGTTAQPATEKTPKSLPAQIWQRQVARYNNVTVDGRPRRFPEREVLGAEKILGRIWDEHVNTKSYTPVGLGELLERRSFTASGDVNPLQKQAKSGQALRLVDDQLVHDEEGRAWTPRSVLAVMDGINSIRWAWVLLQLGGEDHVHAYADWFIQKVRGRAHKLDNMRAFWDAAGWRIAMGMRSGQSFGEVSTEVMADVDLNA